MQTCQFTSFAYILEPVHVRLIPGFLLKFAMQYLPGVAVLFLDYSILNKTYESITGIPLSMKNFIKAGKRIHILERYMNTRMGISKKDDMLPMRFLTEADTKHPVKKAVDLGPMLKSYYKIKGYDADGRPDGKTLAAVGIVLTEVAEEIRSIEPGWKMPEEL